MVVVEYLYFDVLCLCDEVFEIDVVVVECGLCFVLCEW